MKFWKCYVPAPQDGRFHLTIVVARTKSEARSKVKQENGWTRIPDGVTFTPF